MVLVFMVKAYPEKEIRSQAIESKKEAEYSLLRAIVIHPPVRANFEK
jgi:hypothetical protein